MSRLFYCWPQRWAAAVGFHKPTVGGLTPPTSPSQRASSPRLGQGGRLEILMQGIWPHRVHSPHNRISTVVALEPLPYGLPFSNPTTPASAVVDPFGSPSVPSGLCPSADAGDSHVRQGGPTRPPLGEGGRLTPTTGGARHSPLNLLPSRPEGRRLRRLSILADQCIAGRAQRLSWAVSGAGRWR
jgi:hypothetical protein